MTRTDDKSFRAILAQLQKLLLTTVPAAQECLVALENRERVEGTDLSEERAAAAARLESLRQEYAALYESLALIDVEKAKHAVSRLIGDHRQLKQNELLDLQDAKAESDRLWNRYRTKRPAPPIP